MTDQEKARAYDEALERAKKKLHYPNQPCYVEVGEIFPELRESEDERIRQALIRMVLDRVPFGRMVYDGLTRENALAYLEKQKEQKPIQTDTEKEYVRTLKSLVADFVRANNYIERGYYQQIYDWLDGRHIEQKEQKPILKFKVGDKIHLIDGTSPNYEDDCITIREIGTVNYIGEFKEGYIPINEQDKWELVKEQKPVEHHWEQMEWAYIDFDEFTENVRHLIIDKLTTSIPSVGGGKLTSTVFIDDKTAKEIANGILFFIGPQKPAEWSEEDEKMLKSIIDYVSAIPLFYDSIKGKSNKEYTKEFIIKSITFLKSLRPQPQGVFEQAVRAIYEMCHSYRNKGVFTDERACDFMGNVRLKCKDAIECSPILDEPHWKPSEEQMKALEHFVRSVGESGYASSYDANTKALYSLLEQLKKL